MKKITSIPLLFILLIACGETSNKKGDEKTENTSLKKDLVEQTLQSADYSTLLTKYECDMDIAEVAKVLKVAEEDLGIPDYASPGKCSFNLKGFGENVLGDGSQLLWGPSPSSKAQNRKEIASYLERKKNNENFMGMGIDLAETGDCYLAYQPAHGRLIIYNENYDKAFIINYGRRNSNTDRTKEQHEGLKKKMSALANYLLKKHRK